VEARRVLEGFAEAGGNLIDTSDAYLGGEAEKMIGEFLAPHRDDFVVASKFGRTARRSPSLGALGNTRKAMASAVEASLKRLRTDHIDLYFTHFNDRVTPVEEIVRGFEDLVRAGKILYAGLSNFPAWRVAAGATLSSERGWAPVAAIREAGRLEFLRVINDPPSYWFVRIRNFNQSSTGPDRIALNDISTPWGNGVWRFLDEAKGRAKFEQLANLPIFLAEREKAAVAVDRKREQFKRVRSTEYRFQKRLIPLELAEIIEGGN
jgi:hypothetical protein